jgi:hypothetical protein
MPGPGAPRIPYAARKSRISPRELTAAERVIFSAEPRADDAARLAARQRPSNIRRGANGRCANATAERRRVGIAKKGPSRRSSTIPR